MSMSKVHCEKLLERAHLMGMDAGRGSTPTPMIVGSPSTPFGSDIDYSKPTEFVEYLSISPYSYFTIVYSKDLITKLTNSF